MNYLAHLLLAGEHPDHRLGALLGDHLKGRQVLETLRPELARGVLLHRKVDGWSDRHPAATAVVRQLKPPWRRYGGIILDVLFDRQLSLSWTEYSSQPLAEFADEVDRLFASHREELPPRLQRFTRWAADVSLWQRMHRRDVIERVFQLIARRHGRQSPLADGLQILDAYPEAIKTAFDRLMPDLIVRSRDWIQGMPASES